MRDVSRVLRAVMAISMVTILAAVSPGCGKKPAGKAPAASPAQTRPEAITIDFWHPQTADNQDALQKIVADFNASQSKYRVNEVYIGNYTRLYQKLVLSIEARQLPAMAVAYESMVAEYAKAGVVRPLDDLLTNAKVGYSKQELDDFFPVLLETNRFPQFENKTLSFPFTKSVLMLFYSRGMLKEAGFDGPPATWDEFVAQCRAASEKLGKKGYALSIDASTIDGMIYSLGGELISKDRTRTLFDEPAGLKTFQIISDLCRNKSAYQITYQSYDDRQDLGSGRTAFMIRSSTTRPYLGKIVTDLKSGVDWGMAILPHGEGQKPVTVLFGGNVCVFKTTPEQELGAWEFIKFFSSPEVTSHWAIATGYLPVRKSAAETEEMKKFFAEAPNNRAAFDALPSSRNEPNLSRWQEVRSYIEAAETAVALGQKTPEEAVKELTEKANKALAQQ